MTDDQKQRAEIDRQIKNLVIEECAQAAEAYNWVDDEKVQSPDEHQAALAKAIRALKCEPSA